jgi:hypothetical protein
MLFDARIRITIIDAAPSLVTFRMFGQVTCRLSHKVSDGVTNVVVETRT